MSKTTKITRRKERPQQPGAICTLILHKNFLLESHLEVFAADREKRTAVTRAVKMRVANTTTNLRDIL